MTSQDFQRSINNTIREAVKTVPISEVIFHLDLQKSLLLDAVKMSMMQQARQEQGAGIAGPDGEKLGRETESPQGN